MYGTVVYGFYSPEVQEAVKVNQKMIYKNLKTGLNK